jgi:hypothetical protein
MSFHLINYSRPDFGNEVCESSKFMDGANVAINKEIIKLIKFVLDTRNTFLTLDFTLEDEIGIC